jgi:cell division protein FtsI (penicillin-binding protein 3)
VIRQTEPEVVARPISSDTAKIVSEMLRGVVESGTATAARIEGLAVAGKTGTARRIDERTRRYSHREHIASFVGYLPAEAPRFAILVVIDRPKTGMYGGVVAAPVFRRIGEHLADRYGLRIAPGLPQPLAPRPEPVRLVTWSSAVEEGMPSYLGLGMRAAVTRAEKAGWEVETVGSGFVVAQDPVPGEKRISGRKLVLHFGADVG